MATSGMSAATSKRDGIEVTVEIDAGCAKYADQALRLGAAGQLGTAYRRPLPDSHLAE